MGKKFWLVKQEPEAYGWETFVKEGGTSWTGIRNYQARNNLRGMKKGDVVFYYHSGTGKNVVGIAKVEREAYPDKTADEGDWSAVDLKPVKALKVPVELSTIKKDPRLKNMALVKNSRLSTIAVTEEEAKRLLELSETKH
jgi:predicted RNA-binding protein with PUA-like domain